MPRYKGMTAGGRGRRPWNKWIARAVYLSIVLFLAWVVYWLSGILLPFVIGLLVAFVLSPLVTRLQGVGVPRWTGVLLVYSALVAAMVLFMNFLVPIIDVESRKFFVKFNVVLKKAPQMYDRLENGVSEFIDKAVGAAPAAETEVPVEVPYQDADWGFGPPVHKIPTVSPPGISVLDFLTFGSSDEEIAEAGLPDQPSVASVVMEGGEARLGGGDEEASNMTIRQLKPGRWGVDLGTSSVEVKRLGEGTYTISASDQAYETSRWGDIKGQVLTAMRSGLQNLSASLLTGFFTFFQGLVAGILDALIGVVVVFLVGAFLMIDAPRLLSVVRQNVPMRFRDDLDEFLYRLDGGLSGVVRGQLIICLVNGVLTFIGFYFFIREYAVVLAIFAGVMSLVPIFGTIISSVPAILVALSISFGHALGVLSWILIIHMIEAYMLNPNIIGRQARIHPVLVVFVLIAGEHLYGMKGILLAVPVTSVVQSLVQFAYSRVKPYVI